jgi:hypothetical protein
MKLTFYAQCTFPVSLVVLKIFTQTGLYAVHSQYRSKRTSTTMIQVCAHFLSCLKWLSYRHESKKEWLNTVHFISIITTKSKIFSCLQNSYLQPLVNVLQSRIRRDLHPLGAWTHPIQTYNSQILECSSSSPKQEWGAGCRLMVPLKTGSYK